MPTYDYVCDACSHAFELFQQMSDSVKRKCPECGRQSLRRLVGTGAGVIFKGSGFYQTDYRSDSYTKAAEAEKKKPAGADGKPDGKTDGKPDGKTDGKTEGKPDRKTDGKPDRTTDGKPEGKKPDAKKPDGGSASKSRPKSNK